MRPILALALLCLSCGPHYTTFTPAELASDTGATEHTFDTLAAWRKYPGQPKTRQVRGYHRKDSTYVKPYVRSGK